MKLRKISIKGSPFLGVFCRATEQVSLVPHGVSAKEKKILEEILQTEVIACSLANSSLIGVLSVGNQKRFVVPSIVETEEIRALQEIGIAVTKLESVQAIGNLLLMNDQTGVCSFSLSHPTKQAIEKALGIEMMQGKIANSDLVGAAGVLTSKGFVCHPNASKTEIIKIKKITRLTGNRTSANFGDAFVGNSVIANSQGALVGAHSTPHEMMAIEEALSGEA